VGCEWDALMEGHFLEPKGAGFSIIGLLPVILVNLPHRVFYQ
jgi:hypothetical protein